MALPVGTSLKVAVRWPRWRSVGAETVGRRRNPRGTRPQRGSKYGRARRASPSGTPYLRRSNPVWPEAGCGSMEIGGTMLDHIDGVVIHVEPTTLRPLA